MGTQNEKTSTSAGALVSVVAHFSSDDVCFDYEYAFVPPGNGPHYCASEAGSGQVLVAWVGEGALGRMLEDVLIEPGALYVATAGHSEIPGSLGGDAHGPDAAAAERFCADGRWNLARLPENHEWSRLGGDDRPWKETDAGPRYLQADLWNPDDDYCTSSSLNTLNVNEYLDGAPDGWEGYGEWSEWTSTFDADTPPDPGESASDFWFAIKEEAEHDPPADGGAHVVGFTRRGFRSPTLTRAEATFDNGDTLVAVVTPTGVEVSLHGEDGVVAADLQTWLDKVTSGVGAKELMTLVTHADVGRRRQGAALIEASMTADRSLFEQLAVGPLAESRGAPLARVRKLLGSQDIAEVTAGIDLLAQQPPEAIAEMARGCAVDATGRLGIGPEVQGQCKAAHRTVVAGHLARLAGALDGVDRLDLSEDARTAQSDHKDKLTDVGFLRGLQGLRELTVESSNELKSIEPLGEVPGLTTLNIGLIGADDLSPLVRLPNLRDLTVGWIFGEAALPALPALTDLRVEGGGWTTAEPLAGMAGLERLEMVSCRKLEDVSALSALAGLQTLRLSLCGPANPLAAGDRVVVLDWLGIEDGELALQGCTMQGTVLANWLSDAPSPHFGIVLRDLLETPPARLGMTGETAATLRQCVTKMSLSHTGLSDLSVLAGFENVVELELEHCARVSDIRPLAAMKKLEQLNLMFCTGLIRRLRTVHRGAETIAAILGSFTPRP